MLGVDVVQWAYTLCCKVSFSRTAARILHVFFLFKAWNFFSISYFLVKYLHDCWLVINSRDNQLHFPPKTCLGL